jgi:hypothetical protein
LEVCGGYDNHLVWTLLRISSVLKARSFGQTGVTIATPCFAFMVWFLLSSASVRLFGNLSLPVLRQRQESASLAKCLYIFPAIILSCQQRNISRRRVVSIKRRPTLHQARNLRLPPPQSLVAIRENTMFRSKSFSAVSATLTSTKSATSGAKCQLSIHAFLDMRS